MQHGVSDMRKGSSFFFPTLIPIFTASFNHAILQQPFNYEELQLDITEYSHKHTQTYDKKIKHLLSHSKKKKYFVQNYTDGLLLFQSMYINNVLFCPILPSKSEIKHGYYLGSTKDGVGYPKI